MPKSLKQSPAAPPEVVRPEVRLLSKPEVMDRVGVTYPTIWSWMRAGTFPRSRVLGGKTAWIESEVDAWIAALPVRRLKGDA